MEKRKEHHCVQIGLSLAVRQPGAAKPGVSQPGGVPWDLVSRNSSSSVNARILNIIWNKATFRINCIKMNENQRKAAATLLPVARP